MGINTNFTNTLTNILIVGVGGQGTVLTGKVLGKYASIVGADCKLSEVHGMSQRGGSVVTHFRMGSKVHSPVIEEGDADVILAFELLEATRVLHFLKPNGKILVNDIKILPMPCVIGVAEYPEVKERIAQHNAYFISAQKMAEEAGSSKAVNVVLLGAMCKLCGLDYNIMREALTQAVPPRFLQLNLTALQLGYTDNAAQQK